MSRITLDKLTLLVTEYFRRNSAKFGLNAKTVEARYILNWGGFVNASFFIKDGSKTYHLKMADSGDGQMGLVRWRALTKRLSSHYHAPRMLGWVRMPRTSFEGALFQYIPGKPVVFEQQPEILRGVIGLVERLHQDQELADDLAEDEEERTCTDYFLDLYIDRFDQDLVIVADQLPPFVTLDQLTWMMGETRELEGLARDLPAFQTNANVPIHGDLWTDNILVTDDGLWYVIDWDDLALGDPAIEYSILLGPLWRSGYFTKKEVEARLPVHREDPGFLDRFRLGLRALVLDQIIDSLADWVEAEYAPVHLPEVRQAKQQKFLEALNFYQKHFS